MSFEKSMTGLSANLMDQFHLARARGLIDRGELEEAGRVIARVRGDGHSAGLAWRLKGRLVGRAGLPVAAVECLQSALRFAGATQRTVLELAYWMNRARDFERSEEILRRFLDHHPGDRLGATLLAHVFRAQGRFRTAVETLRTLRPKNVAGKYANVVLPQPKLAWNPSELWRLAVQRLNRVGEQWSTPDVMALDRDLRDDLLCFLDELGRTPGGTKAMAWGVGRTLSADVAWLMPYVRRCTPFLRLRVPRDLPMFIARHGNAGDKSLLLAGLAEGGETRILAAVALISTGFDEYEEVLLEARETTPAEPVSETVWSLADDVLAGARA